MPWYEKQHPIPFDQRPVSGLFQLNGDILAKRYRQEWIQGKKYPTISFPSGLVREFGDSSGGGGIINIFGAFELLQQGSRDEGFAQAIEFACEYDSEDTLCGLLRLFPKISYSNRCFCPNGRGVPRPYKETFCYLE